LNAAGLEVALRIAYSLLAAGAEGNVAVLGGEGKRYRPADAAAAARDDGYLILEPEVQTASSSSASARIQLWSRRILARQLSISAT
jgi:hypothetical protein